jgi:hypothetical protein
MNVRFAVAEKTSMDPSMRIRINDFLTRHESPVII